MEINKNFSNRSPPSPPAIWSRSENKKFENALATYGIENPEIWKTIAATLPGKSSRDIEVHYENLVHDIMSIEMGRIELPKYKDDVEGDCDHDGDGLIDETAGELREIADVHENGILEVGVSDVHEAVETLRDIPLYNQVSDVYENGILEVGVYDVHENGSPNVGASDLNKKGFSEVGVSVVDENGFLELGVSDVHENRFLEVSNVHENGFLEFSDLHENRFLEVGVSDVHENGSLQVMLTDDAHNNGFLEARASNDVHENGFLEIEASNVHENRFLEVSDVHDNRSLKIGVSDVLGVEVSHVHEKGIPELGARSRKRGRSWTEEEHRNFLMGLDHERRGDWKTISRFYVPSKTPAQISSHAQKYFNRQKVVESGNARRKSIHDLTKME